MKAIFLILSVFATFVIILGYTADSSGGVALNYALVFGGFAIYFGVFAVWISFKIKERNDSK